MAARLAAAGAIAIVAAVSPYEADRTRVRAVLEQAGFRFVEVHVQAPLAACIERDPKGLYGRALRGELAGVTGLDAPYEPPRSPDVVVDTATATPASCVAAIVEALDRRGFVASSSTAVA